MELDKTQETDSQSDQLIDKELIIPCHSRKMSLWLILLDNIPTLLLFIFGFLIIDQISAISAIIFGTYALFSIVWFWAKICPYCHHYDTYACPCGYGAISPVFFKKGDTKSFVKVFKRNIWIVFPNWFIPLGVAIYLLSARFTKELLIQTIIFIIIGFIIIPLVSKLIGCKNCEINEDCPWMTIYKREKYKKA